MLKRNLIANYVGQGWVALMGFAFVPTSTLEPGQPRHEVAALHVADVRLHHPVALVHRRPAPTSPAARVLVEQILRQPA